MSSSEALIRLSSLVAGGTRNVLSHSCMYFLQVRNDLLSRFMMKDVACDGEVGDKKRLRDVCINFIIAGRDTTAVTLSWFFSELCKHPEIVKNILAEVSQVLHSEQESTQNDPKNNLNGNGKDYQGFAQRLTYQSLTKMHYLHAALTEALRLYPAVPLVNFSTHSIASH